MLYPIGLQGNGRYCYQLVCERDMESPEETRRRCFAWAIEKMTFAFTRHAIKKWISVTNERKVRLLRTRSAKITQRKWRVYRDRASSALLYEMKLMEEQIKRNIEAARKRAEEEAIQKERDEREREQGRLDKGITIDGITFFKTKKEMNQWIARRSMAANKTIIAVTRLAVGKMNLAFDQWKSIWWSQRMIDAAINGHLLHVPRGELERLHKGDIEPINTGQWHPSLGLHLPILPEHSCVLNNVGKMEIKNFEQFKKFRAYMRGPTDVSNWIIKTEKAGGVCMGAYPQAQAQLTNDKISLRSSAVAQLLLSGFNTFVCLMSSTEIESMIKARQSGNVNSKRFEEDIYDKMKMIRADLELGVAANWKNILKLSELIAEASQYSDATVINHHIYILTLSHNVEYIVYNVMCILLFISRINY